MLGPCLSPGICCASSRCGGTGLRGQAGPDSGVTTHTANSVSDSVLLVPGSLPQRQHSVTVHRAHGPDALDAFCMHALARRHPMPVTCITLKLCALVRVLIESRVPAVFVVRTPVHGRFAPSPTGLLHIGSARTALAAWLSARSAGGRFTLRMEDLDMQRVVEGAARSITEDLHWLGLDFDASPQQGGSDGPYVQSACTRIYAKALHSLYRAGHLFPCTVSRSQLRSIASAPHGPERGSPYPKRLRPKRLYRGWFDRSDGAAIRFRVPERDVHFSDRVFGLQTECVARAVGDFVLRRRDGVYAYQLAVVVDDMRMGITEVVRGQDLLASTARQILLIEALGGMRPSYGHVPLVLNADGEKLSKRDSGLTVQSLRDAGVSADALIGYLAYTLGLTAAPVPQRPAELIADFSWQRLRRAGPWRLPRDLISTIA